MGQPLLRLPTSHVRRPLPLLPEFAERVSVVSPDGQPISAALAEVSRTPGGWSANLHHVERPGALTAYYFSKGRRDIVLRLPDAAFAYGRITSASFSDGSRVYRLEGEGAFVQPAASTRELA
jgi:hypothetical protein